MNQAPPWPSTIALVTLMALFSTVAAAQTLYRWLDADGNVQYSDQPPPADAKDARTLNRGLPISDENDGDDSKSYVEQEVEFQERSKKRAEEELKERKEAETAALWKSNCDSARSELQALNSGGRKRQYNEQGELVFMTSEQVEREKKEASEEIQKWCKN